MASSLSEDEFHRMQLQLLELRTVNYELEGKCKKFERDISWWQEHVVSLDKELQRCNKAIQKSKKIKEVNDILQENTALHGKLDAQEADFMSQNQALMDELASLVSANEDLEKKVSDLSSNDSRDETDSRLTENQNETVIKLQALNQVLLNKLEEKTSNQHQDGDNAEDSDLKMRLDAEVTEKNIFKEELNKMQNKTSSMQDEINMLSEKLKKKQESFVALQEEKEQMYNDHVCQRDESSAARDRDHKYYNDQIAKCQQEISTYKQKLEATVAESAQKITHLEDTITGLRLQHDAADAQEQEKAEEKMKDVLSKLTESNTQLTLARKKCDDLSTELQETKSLYHSSMDQLCAAQQERDVQIQSLQEANKLAEKRKSYLDDLAIKSQKEADSYHSKIRQLEDSHQNEINDLQKQIKHDQTTLIEVEKLKKTVEEMKSQVSLLEETKGWLERSLKETEGKYVEMEQQYEEKIKDMDVSHNLLIDSMKQTHQSECQTSSEAQRILQSELEDKTHSIDQLNEIVKDRDEEKRIYEKKGQLMLKDLKRQLHSERKRAEKLQDRLQEALCDTQDSEMDGIFGVTSANSSCHTDKSSVSALSAATSGSGNKEPNTVSSPIREGTPSDDIELENVSLLEKIASIQQGKWNMEEKVRHLEETNAAMAEDLLQKTAIIQHYIMEVRSGPVSTSHNRNLGDKPSLKKVLNLVKRHSDDEMTDMNRKLQRMLEETLTKNMHLQKDMEVITKEIMRLSSLVGENDKAAGPHIHETVLSTSRANSQDESTTTATTPPSTDCHDNVSGAFTADSDISSFTDSTTAATSTLFQTTAATTTLSSDSNTNTSDISHS